MNVGIRQNPSVPVKMIVSKKPKAQKERVITKHVLGKSNREIAAEEGIDKDTVAVIVKEPDVQKHVESLRELWYSFGLSALAAEKYQLDVKKDGRFGHKVLQDMGVIPKQTKDKEPEQQKEWSEKDGQLSQAYQVACMMQEAHDQMGVDYPDSMKEMIEGAHRHKEVDVKKKV